MLHTVLRRKGAGESVEAIQPDLIIPTGKRKGHPPSLASIYRALAEYEKTLAYLEAVEQAHTEYAELRRTDAPTDALCPRPARVFGRQRRAGNSALRQLVIDMPPAVAAQALGYSPQVAEIHAKASGATWVAHSSYRSQTTRS